MFSAPSFSVGTPRSVPRVPSVGAHVSQIVVPTYPYTTTFPSTENPISETGRWTNGKDTGVDWQNVRTLTGSPNRAFASVNATGYDDSIAILSGFPADQSVEVVIYNDPTYTAPDTHEIELLLRFQVSAHAARGYEIDCWAGGGNLQIIRWDTPSPTFPSLTITGPKFTSLATGDIVKAQMVGSTITVYKNGVLVATATDTTYTDGNPGMGFFPRTGCTPEKYCISQFTAAAA